MSYTATSDPNVVTKTTERDEDIHLDKLVAEFVTLRDGILALPKTKSTPDQDTLDHWNDVVVPDAQREKERLDDRATKLYDKIKPVYDAGLLPTYFNVQYQALEDYVNGL